jgi:hypothetical protein
VNIPAPLWGIWALAGWLAPTRKKEDGGKEGGGPAQPAPLILKERELAARTASASGLLATASQFSSTLEGNYSTHLLAAVLAR